MAAYKISDWDDNVLELTPGGIIEKLLKEEDEYGNLFTSYTELARVCQIEGFPGVSLRAIAILSIRHELRMLVQGIRNERITEDPSAEDRETVESVSQGSNSIIIDGISFPADFDFEEFDGEDDYDEIEDYYKFDGEDETALSFFFNYLIGDTDRGVQINLQKFVSLTVLSVVYHVNTRYELDTGTYEWSNHWCHEMTTQIWQVASKTGLDVRGLNLFIEKLYLEILFEKVGSEVVPQEDVEEAIQSETFYEIEQEHGSAIFWESWRQAEAMTDDEAEAYLANKAWEDFINVVSDNINHDVYPMRTIYIDEDLEFGCYDEYGNIYEFNYFEKLRYPRGW